MHDFLLTIFLGLALFKIVDLLEELAPGITRFHTLATLIVAVGGVYALDYSIFSGYDVALRESYMGLWATGFIVAGTTSLWRAMFHWLGSAEGEEPDVRHQAGPRSMAA